MMTHLKNQDTTLMTTPEDKQEDYSKFVLLIGWSSRLSNYLVM
jgi:hypothetical protein